MAVTTTYSLNFIKNLDLTQGPTTGDADATSLANGGFAVSGGFLASTALDIFNPDTSDGGGAAPLYGVGSALDQLSDGNIALATYQQQAIIFYVRTETGAIFRGPYDLGTVASSNPDVAALTGGKFVIVLEQAASATDHHLIGVIMSNDGVSDRTPISIDVTTAQTVGISIAGLDSGDFAAAWTRHDGADTEIWYAVYNSAGGIVRAPGLFDTFGTVNRNVSVSAKADGFVIAYEDNGWGTGTTDITLAQFSLNGTYERLDNVSNPSLVDDNSDEANPHVTRLSNNSLAVTCSEFFFPDGDTVVRLIDPATAGVLATRYVTGGESASDDVQFSTAAGFYGGGIAVFHRNVTDNDADGEHVQAQRTSTGDGAADTINGDSLADVMFGNGGGDTLRGFAGNDTLRGGPGNDRLVGGLGRDVMTGGNGADRFVFTNKGESGLTVGSRDRVTDFTHLTDDVDLAAIDAKASIVGNDTFSFRGTLAFNAEGQVRVVQSGLHTIVQLNTSGTTGAEMTLQLDNVTATALTPADFFF